MAIAWFICPYKRRYNRGTGPDGQPMRIVYCAMDDFTAQINADGGSWAESQVLGGVAVVKVSASDATLTTIAGATGFIRIPNAINLSDPLSSLTTAQRNVIRNKLISMGYTTTEIDIALSSDLRTKTLGDLLEFAARRRLAPRYDAETDTIVFDGVQRTCRSISNVDEAVK